MDDIRLRTDGFRVGSSIGALDVRWSELSRIEALYPWPSLMVEWRNIGGLSSAIYTPASKRWHERSARDIQGLIEHVRAHRPHAVTGGWCDEPSVQWERVDAIPGEAEDAPDKGAYRTANRRVPEEIVAERGTATVGESLLQWLGRAAGETQPVSHRIVVTTRAVYRQDPNGGLCMVPNHAFTARVANLRGFVDLRTMETARFRVTTRDYDEIVWTDKRTDFEPYEWIWKERSRSPDVEHDRIYHFGPAAYLVVPFRERCPVQTALDGLFSWPGIDAPEGKR